MKTPVKVQFSAGAAALAVATFGLAALAFAADTPSALAGEMKPYQGWLMFPPITGADGASYSVRHDNVGGVGLRRAIEVGALAPVFDPVSMTLTLTRFEEGVITYPNGDTLWDTGKIVLVFQVEWRDGRPTPTLLLGGTAEAEFIDGTGRFEGAHGWGKIEVWFDEPLDLATAEPFRMPFEGMISTVGSLKGTK